MYIFGASVGIGCETRNVTTEGGKELSREERPQGYRTHKAERRLLEVRGYKGRGEVGDKSQQKQIVFGNLQGNLLLCMLIKKIKVKKALQAKCMTSAHTSRDLAQSTAVSQACFQMPVPKARGSARQGGGPLQHLAGGRRKPKSPAA